MPQSLAGADRQLVAFRAHGFIPYALNAWTKNSIGRSFLRWSGFQEDFGGLPCGGGVGRFCRRDSLFT